MPTPGEYEQPGILPAALPTEPAGTSPATEPPSVQPTPSSTQTPPDCTALEPLFQQSPELRAQFACPLPEQVPPVIDECKGIAAQLQQAISNDMAACLEVCQQTADQCKACIFGAIQRDLDAVNAVAAKCGVKIQTYLDDKVHNLVAAMDVIGIPPPDENQLAAALAGLPIPPAAVPPVGEVPPVIEPIYVGPIGQPTPQPITFPPIIQPPQGGPAPCAPFNPLTGLGDPSCGIVRQPPQRPPAPPIIPPQQPPAGGLQCPPPQPYQIAGVTVGTITFSPRQIRNDAGQVIDTVCEATVTRGPVGPIPPTGPGGGGPPPPPPGPCPTCGAGYHFEMDDNGNPVCVKDCKCPPCPPCPPPPPPPEGTPPGGEPDKQWNGGPLGCGPGASDAVKAFIDAVTPTLNYSDKSPAAHTISDWFIENLKDTLSLGIAGKPPEFLVAFRESLTSFVKWATDTFVSPWFPAGDCNRGQAIALGFAAALPKFLDKWFGIVPHQIDYALDQWSNFTCQYVTPTQSDVNIMWARGWITEDQWTFGTKIGGYCVDWQKCVRELSHTRISILDAYRLNKLEQLTDDDFKRAWREQGVDWDRDADTWKDAVKQYPGLSGLIRYMAANVEDSGFVQRYQLDDGFADRWVGNTQQWGAAQGIPDEVAMQEWRTHWQGPAINQLFVWMQRLRPDDRDPEDPFISTVITQEDVKQFLKLDGRMPGLIDAYIATSYRPLIRRDIARLYRSGTLEDRAALRRAYKDLGYNDHNARLQADFIVVTEGPTRAKLQGFLSENEIIKQYYDGLISGDEATRNLIDAGVKVEWIGQRLESADMRRNAANRKRVREALRKRYFMGEFDMSEIQNELVNADLPEERAQETAYVWEQERKARAKHPVIGMLCKMFERGLIQMQEYMQRVKNLNYPEADALLVIENCVIGIKERQAKQLEQEAMRQERARKQANRDAARLARELAPCRVVKPVCPGGPSTRRTYTQERRNGKYITSDKTVTGQQEPPQNIP